MKEAFKKQVTIGITGCLGTALVAVVVYNLWGMPDNRWITYAALAVLTACFFGSLLYIFGGKRALFNGAGYGFGFVVLTVTAKELPAWAFGIIIMAAVLIFVVRPLFRQYKRDREKGNDIAIDEKAAEEVRQEEAFEAEMMKEDDAFKASIGFGEKSLLLLANLVGAFYQVIRGGDALYFVRIGGELSGMDETLVRTDFSDEAGLIKGKKDFRLRFDEIVSIQCRYRRERGTPLENCGRLTIKTDRKKTTYAILDTLPVERIEAFFAGLPFSLQGKSRPEQPAPEPTEEEKAMLPRLKKICLALTVLAVIAGVAFMFLPIGPVVYRILSAACMLIPIVTGILYAKYNTLLSIEDKSRDEAVFKKSGVNVIIPLLIPSVVLMLRTIYDFTVTDWAGLLIWSGTIFMVILLLLLAFTTEYKRKKSVIVLFVMAALAYAPSAVLHINGLYDSSTPTVYSSQLLDKHISDGRSSTFYYFTVEMGNGKEKDIGVSPEYYEERGVGDTVTVVEQSGLLGIDYVYIAEGE